MTSRWVCYNIHLEDYFQSCRVPDTDRDEGFAGFNEDEDVVVSVDLGGERSGVDRVSEAGI